MGLGGVALERGEHVDMGFEIEVPSSEYDDYMEVSDVSSTEKRMCRVTFIRFSMYHSKAFYILYVFKFLVQDLSSMVRTIHTRLMRYRLALGIRVLVLIALFLSCYGCQKRDYAEAVDAIEARLTMIEQRVTQFEKMEQRISAYEFQLKELRESLRRLDNLVTEILEAPQTIKGQPATQGKGGYYLVHRGDSLYGIAQEYGLTVEELRRLNNLSKGHVIYPGQKLLVNSKRAQ